MAEVVDYSVVWEEEKQQSNVVDYNIREEQTKDVSNMENANNQTTTGMANVIPWINAPKLIAETSIIWDVGWWGWWASIVEISDYLSVEEWQPVVDRVLAWEFVAVICKFTEYSSLMKFYFTPSMYLANSAIRFWAITPWSHWFRITISITWTTVDSVGSAHWSWTTSW